MRKRKHPWKKRKRTVSFNPDRSFLQKAINEYLAGGGSISTVTPDNSNYQTFLEIGNSLTDADEFLIDR